MANLRNAGGKRPNAGRKSVQGEPTKTMRLPAAMADTITLIRNAPDTAMIIWWTTQQDCERSDKFIEPESEIADLFDDRWGRAGRGRIWSDLTLKQPIPPPDADEDIGGILMSVEVAKQICYLPGIWQIIPKTWVAD